MGARRVKDKRTLWQIAGLESFRDVLIDLAREDQQEALTIEAAQSEREQAALAWLAVVLSHPDVVREVKA